MEKETNKCNKQKAKKYEHVKQRETIAKRISREIVDGKLKSRQIDVHSKQKVRKNEHVKQTEAALKRKLRDDSLNTLKMRRIDMLSKREEKIL